MTRAPSPIMLTVFALFLVVSSVRFESIGASLISMATWVAMLLVDPFFAREQLQFELIEYWIAALVWLGGGLLLARSLVRRRNDRRRLRSAEGLLIGIGFAALTAPLVAPVSPLVQGDLLTTRLLPPLSFGICITTTEPRDTSETEGWLARAFATSSRRLIHRSEKVVADTDTSSLRGEGHSFARPIVFLFGTDDSGRDVFTRVIFGARVSMAIGLAAALGAVLIGASIGFAAGFGSRVLDTMLMRFTDLMLSIPSLFLIVGALAFLPSSLVTVILILAGTGWMSTARLVRTEVLRLREQEFVLAARLLGHSSVRILFRHIVPHVKGLLLTAAMLQFAGAVLAEASLSFLGLGVQPPTPSWGNLLGQALAYIRTGWWMSIFPGGVLAAVLIALFHVAERRTGAAQ